MKTRFYFYLSTALLAYALSLRAVTVATPPVGGIRLEAAGGRDNWLSLPLVRRSTTIQRVTAVGATTISVAENTFIADAYAPASTGSYYVQFVTGNLAGLAYKIIGNTTDQLTLATAGDDLTAHLLGAISVGPAGDLIRIRPYWTVSDVFGQESTDLLLEPVALLAPVIYSRSDALIFPDNETRGTVKLPAAVLAYVSGQGWRRQGEPTIDQGATELPGGVPFVWRKQNSPTRSTLLVGYVALEPGVIRLPALPANEETDVAVALFQPQPVRLADAGLEGVIDSAIEANSSRDLLLSPADTRHGFSLPPERWFYRIGAAWFEGDIPADDQTLRSDTGYLLRLRGERPVRYWRQPDSN